MKSKVKSKADIDLNLIALERLRKLDKSAGGVIKYRDVFIKLCSSLQLPKIEVWKLLYKFKLSGDIDIVPYEGVRILRDM